MRKIYYLSLFFIVFALCGCDAYPVKEDVLMGKSKEEIIGIAFQHFPRILNNEIQISVFEQNKTRTSYYYKTIEDALSDPRIMGSNTWAIGYKRSFSLNGTINFYKLKFKNNQVIEVIKSGYSDL